MLKKDSYNIEKWDDVDDLSKLESGYYDLILLDIQGVGRSHSSDQGLGVLRHLRFACPAQLIIAFSNADFSLRYKEFFDLADATLPKQADYVDFKRTVDGLLGKRFSVGFYLDRISKLASPYQSEGVDIRKAAEKAIASNDARYLESALKKAELGSDVAQQILGILKAALTIGASFI